MSLRFALLDPMLKSNMKTYSNIKSTRSTKTKDDDEYKPRCRPVLLKSDGKIARPVRYASLKKLSEKTCIKVNLYTVMKLKIYKLM